MAISNNTKFIENFLANTDSWYDYWCNTSWTGERGWVHLKGANSMTASVLSFEKAPVGTVWIVSLLLCMIGLRMSSCLVGLPFLVLKAFHIATFKRVVACVMWELKTWVQEGRFRHHCNYSVKKLQFLLFINRMLTSKDTFHLYFYKPEGGSGNETGSRTNGTLWYTSEIDSKYWNCSLSDYWSLKWAQVFVIIVRLIVSLDVACTMKLRDRADSGRTGNWRIRKPNIRYTAFPRPS